MKRRRRQQHRQYELPFQQFDAAAERKRILQQLEALALQGDGAWQRALELVPFEAIDNDSDPFWQDEPRVLAIKCLLEIDVLNALNQRRMK